MRRREDVAVAVLVLMSAALIATSAAWASGTTRDGAPVSAKMLKQCFNEHGGYLHDNLMVGSPCPAFMNRKRVLTYVKRLLIDNGFRPAMTLTKYWARQIGLDGLQDGIEYSVLVVKSGPHQLGIQRGGYSGVGGLYVDRINVAFIP